MKTGIAALAMGLLLIGGNLYAADGDLIVDGTLNVGSGGVKYPDGSIQTTAISPTTQNNVTASRAIGTVYQNTTGKPMFVSISVTTTTSAGNFYVYSNSSNPPTTVVQRAVVSDTAHLDSVSLGFWVLSNNYYKVTVTNTPVLYNWVETY